MVNNFQELIILILWSRSFNTMSLENNNSLQNELSEHAAVADATTFPYMTAILQKTRYLSSGALIDESWVLTGADSLYTIRESLRTLRVRLGTTNYKQGGYLTPAKLLEIHPYFDDSRPLFDVALIKLAKPVKLTPSIYPVRYLKRPRKVVTTHFTVPAWPMVRPQYHSRIEDSTLHINHALTVSHPHPTDPERCSEELETKVPDYTESVLCLDPGIGSDLCQRDVGAPVVLNGILWGIVSSWKSEDCDAEPIFVTLVTDVNVSSWIHTTIFGHKSRKTHVISNSEDYFGIQ